MKIVRQIIWAKRLSANTENSQKALDQIKVFTLPYNHVAAYLKINVFNNGECNL